MSSETVLCVGSSAAGLLLKNEGYTPTEASAMADTLRHLEGWFGPRSVLETNENFKQIIPYVMLTHQGQFASYRRMPKGTEGRLHGKRSLGFGGHIGLDDVVNDGAGGVDLIATIERAAAREISEEILCPPVVSRTMSGWIYETASAVSRVHLGVVIRWELSSTALKAVEDQLGEIKMESLAEVAVGFDEFEGWSQAILQKLVVTESKQKMAANM